MTSVTDLIEKVIDVRSNPANIQDVVYSVIPEMLGGEYDVVDPNNPVALCIESACYLTAAAIQQNETLSRREYPILANRYEDLYLHMSDVDYLDRFAKPTSAEFQLILSMDEVLEKAVKVDDNLSVLSIPRDTRIEVDGIGFTLYYPIDIRVLSHGGLQVVYNTSRINPMKTLESNVLDWEIVRFRTTGQTSNGRMIKITIPADQIVNTVHYDQLNPSTGFSKTYAFTDKFYYCRVWHEVNNQWVEVKTTHSDQTYDSTVVTTLLIVTDNQVSVKIPQIYFSRNLLGSNVRVDVYTTKGVLSTSFESYTPDVYDVDWLDHDLNESPTNIPIRSFSNKTLFSTSRINGGANELTFNELRDRVINNSLGLIETPITDAQLTFKMSRMGYSVLKDVDSITSREYVATRNLPMPSGLAFSTEIGSTIKTLMTDIERISTHSSIYDNGVRVTLKSNTLFKLTDGRLSLVNDVELDALTNMSPESKVAYFNNNEILMNPFHYVLDTTSSVFEARPYYINDPKILSKEFISENESTLLEISAFRYAIEVTTTGFKMVVITRGSELTNSLDDNQIHMYLTYVPPGEFEVASLKGNIVGRTDDGDYVVEFYLNTNFDIDSNDRLLFTNFKMFDSSDRNIATTLTNKFDIVIAVSDYSVEGIRKTEIDELIPSWDIVGDYYSIIRETFTINLAEALGGLWSKSRTIASEADYMKHPVDVYMTYSEDIYEKDPVTGLPVLENTPDGIRRVKLHSAGDWVLDGGEKILKHRAGDVVLDSNNEPVIELGRRTNRHVDLFLVEGMFSIVTDSTIRRYYNESIRTITHWITNDIFKLSKKLHENTTLSFNPKSNMGVIDIYVNSDTPTSVNASQSLSVKFYLTEVGYRNEELKNILQTISKDVISKRLNRRTISINDIASQIKSLSSEEVISVEVSGLGGESNYSLLTIRNDDASMSIRKRLFVLPDNTITIDDSISFEWVRHTGGS